MPEYSKPLGDVVKCARKRLDLTQNEVADSIQVDVRTIINIENFKGKGNTTLVKGVLSVPCGYLSV